MSQIKTKRRASRLVGLRIMSIDLNAFPDCRGGFAYDPVIVLSDGSKLRFQVQETDSCRSYGVALVCHTPNDADTTGQEPK